MKKVNEDDAALVLIIRREIKCHITVDLKAEGCVF